MTDPGKPAPVFRFGLADQLGTAFTTGLPWAVLIGMASAAAAVLLVVSLSGTRS